MIWWIVGSMLYLAIAGLFLFTIVGWKRSISRRRKQFARHPERLRMKFGGLASDVICSLLWPLQILGLLFYGMKG